MARALAAAAVLVAAFGLPSLAVAAEPGSLRLYVRVEGEYATTFRGWVDVPEQVTFTAERSGEAYAIAGDSPLGALLAAAAVGSFEVGVTDEFLGIDFGVNEVAGERWEEGLRWWDARVNHVAFYYGNHYGWRAFGPGLHTGDEVLWYVDGIGVTPLRVQTTGSATLPDGTCVAEVAITMRFPDLQHQPGRPWPSATWAPATPARLEGSSNQALTAVNHAVVAVAAPGATVWADEIPEATSLGLHYVRSDRLDLACPA